MNRSKVKAAALNVRVPDKIHSAFHKKAKQYGTPSYVLRELVVAFIEDRVVIKPPVTKGTLYHVD